MGGVSKGKARMVLLIAEDDYGHFLLTRKHLRRWGFDIPIIRFADGRDVLDFLHAMTDMRVFDTDRYLLLLDVNMPDADGFEVLEQIKKTEKFKGTKVAKLTTVKDQMTIDRCYSLGCCGYLTKPLKEEDFCVLLKKLDIPLPRGSVVKEAGE